MHPLYVIYIYAVWCILLSESIQSRIVKSGHGF